MYIRNGRYLATVLDFTETISRLCGFSPLFLSPLLIILIYVNDYLNSDDMGKRHNRKRTRSRPRNRDGGGNITPQQQPKNHTRSDSVSTTTSTLSATSSCFTPQYYPVAHVAWQNRLRNQREQEEVESQRLRIFGGLPEDEASLLEPMLKVVTDLFDGFYDYEDP
jgi:hypothetical protein